MEYLIITMDTLIATKLDSLIIKNHQNFNELSKAIIGSNNEIRLIKFVSNDVLFTLVVTLSVFVLGGLVKWIWQLIELSKKKRDTRKFIKYYLDKVIPNVEDIEIKYKEISDETNINTGLDIIAPKVLTHDWCTILKIDAREMYFSFREKEAINKIIRQLDSIDEIVSTCGIYHNLLLQKTDRITEKLQLKYKDFRNSVLIYTEYIRKQNPDNYRNDKIYIFLNEHILNHIKEVKENFRNTMKFHAETLRPILIYLVDSDLFRNSQYAENITTEANHFSDLYFELSKTLEDFSKQYAEYSKIIRTARISIVDNREKIKWPIQKISE